VENVLDRNGLSHVYMQDMKTRQQLERGRQRLIQALPPLDQLLRGSLIERTVRCGKPTCWCAEGEGHEVFLVGMSFPGGKTRQVTLPRDIVPVAREWIANYDRLWQHIEEVSAINRELLRQRWVDPPRRRGRRR